MVVGMVDVELAAEAFLYGYPLVFDVSQVVRSTGWGWGRLR
jgi:hypothetical protein